MGLGDSVTALLETYSNCLKLLKAFGKANAHDDGSDDSSLLRRSIKTDRSKVRRAYSSRLSTAGSKFDKGDAPSRSALRRVLRRLKAAIVNLLHLSKSQSPVLDYASLVSLSNASRVDTIDAFDQLSRRLGSTPSRASIASSRKSNKQARKRSSGSSDSNASASSTSRDASGSSHKKSKSKRSSERSSSRHRKDAAVRPEPERRGSHGTRDHSSKDDSGGSQRRKSQQSQSSAEAEYALRPSGSGSSRTVVANRISYASIATDSTKLGEIPSRKWPTRHDSDMASDGYNIPTTYPLKPYKPPEKERRFFGLFKR